MGDIKVVSGMVDHGWPDEGHYEWYLVDATPRKNKFLQWLLGDKEKHLLCYGENRPDDITIKRHIKVFKEERWHLIPRRCEYNGKIYSIINIDWETKLLSLQDINVKDGLYLQVIGGIPMESCNPLK